MKRILFVLLFAVVGHFTLSAQTEFKKIVINDADIYRNNSVMTVNMDLDFTKLDVNSNRAVLITPYIVKGDSQKALPALGIYGRNRYFYYVRNDQKLTEYEIKEQYIESDVPEYLPYTASIPFENWMSGSELVIERKVYGCCGHLEEEDYCTLDIYRVFNPDFLYVKAPKPEKKERFIEGNAFVDYPVSQTVIYPEYHNNTYELSKIKGTIDSVKLDNDITVTSIFIKGYASPESPYDNNTRLAKGRTESIKEYVLGFYDFERDLIRTDYEPENWEGLREYLVESNLTHKSQIINMIDADMEPDRKEWLIKSKYKDEYKYLLENCYPYLRRTYYRIDYIVRSFTEGDVDHIRELVTTRPQNLSLEEFYLASQGLDPESDLFQEIFDVAVRMYPSDEIANINAANVAMQRGDMQSALKYINRSGSSPEAIYARGVYAALDGDYSAAASFFQTAAALGVEQAKSQLEQLSFLSDN